MRQLSFLSRLWLIAPILSCLLNVGCKETIDEAEIITSQLHIPGGQVRNLGKVEQGSMAETQFELVNHGDEPIVLNERIDLSCGCTSAELTASTINPGESVTLNIVVDIADMDAPNQQVSAAIEILKPTPKKKFVVLVNYAAYAAWSVKPSRMRLVGTTGTTCRESFRIAALSDRNLVIEHVETDCDDMNVIWSPLDENNKTEIEITYTLPEQPMSQTTHVYVHTSGAAINSKVVEIECIARSPILVEPQSLLIAPEDSSQIVSRFVHLQSEYPCSIEEVSSPNEHIHFIYDTLPVSNEHSIQVDFAADALKTAYERLVAVVRVVGNDRETECELPIVIVGDSDALVPED